MGNSHSHGVGERRKSGSGTPNRHSSGSGNQEKESSVSAVARELRDTHVIGPLDVTTKKRRPSSGSTTSAPAVHKNTNSSAAGGFRPRSTTESGPRRQASTGEEKSGKIQFTRKLPTIIKYSAKNSAKEVYVSGTFNNWKKMPMVKSQKDFVAIVELQEGDHEYKIMVDGQWVKDEHAPAVKNSRGEENNLIHVQKEDFDAYDALDMDSAAVLNRKKQSVSTEFGQEIPQYNSMEHRAGPPILPPHLLQVILNKDTPLSCEPTLLPEPNHVVINHLYALSIKDGVMVLSSTQRFRKKYVTTLLYKPMGSGKND